MTTDGVPISARFKLPEKGAVSRHLIARVKLEAINLIRGLEGPPFDLTSERVLKGAAIKSIQHVSSIRAYGRIFWDASGYVVQLKAVPTGGRPVFTLGHEIAHTFFMTPGDRAAQRTDGATGGFADDQGEEYLCDVAAAEMLMPAEALIDARRLCTPEAMARPENSFLRRVIAYRPSAKTLIALAREFRTSLSATAWRFAEMGIWSCHIGFWSFYADSKPTFSHGYASHSIDLRIAKGHEASERSIVSCAARERRTLQGWSDIGLVSSRGESCRKTFVQALPMRGGRIITMAVFEPAPEHLIAAFDRRRSRGAPRQAVFRFMPRN